MSEVREALENAMRETRGEAPPEAPAPAVETATEAAPVETAPEATEAAPAAEKSSTGGRDQKGRFAGKAQTKTDAPVAAKPTTTAPAQKTGFSSSVAAAPVQGQTTTTTEALKAPATWKAGAREHFDKLPRAVQEEVVRREKEAYAREHQTEAARQFTEKFQSTVSPYLGMIQAEGGEPMAAISSLLQTSAALRTAPPAHKAKLVAHIIRQFGVPIDALDMELAGGAPQQGQQGQAQGGYADPRVDQLTQQLQQLQGAIAGAARQRQQSSNQKVQSELQAFAQSHEFFEDLREDMSDLMAGAARQQRAMTLQEAYDRASRMNDDVWDTLQRRDAAKVANAGNASTSRARNAASSVKSQPAGNAQASQPKGLRGDLEAAFASVRGR